MEHHSTIPANHDVEHAQSRDRLIVFREEVGITDVLSIDSRHLKRFARNIGLYQRVVSAEKHARIQYYASACLINSCLLLQIVFAATLTSLGAANGSNIAITGVGAANTVIAGLLSFTKGQGLPNRLMQYQNALRKVREYIEQRERDFAQLDCKLDVYHEIQTIVEMYESVRNNDEANDPNAYHNTLDLSAKNSAAPKESLNRLMSSLPKTVEALVGSRVGQGTAQGGVALTGGGSEPPPETSAPTPSSDHQDRDIVAETAKNMLIGKNNW